MTETPGVFRTWTNLASIAVVMVVYWGAVFVLAYAFPASWFWWVRGLVALFAMTGLLAAGFGILVALDSHEVVIVDDDEAAFWNE